VRDGKGKGNAVERPAPKRPIRLASEGPDGQRRDTMFGDFVKTPPETPGVPEVLKISRWEKRKSKFRLPVLHLPDLRLPTLHLPKHVFQRNGSDISFGCVGIEEPLLSMPYNAAEPMVMGINRPLQSRTPEIPPKNPGRARPPMPPVPSVPDNVSPVSSRRVNTMQRTYTLPGNPFADFDGVHSPAIAEEAEDDASRDSWEGYSLDSLTSDGNLRPLASREHVEVREPSGGVEYVPPRNGWGRWSQMNGRTTSTRNERTDKRDTKFYKFYDEILDEEEEERDKE